eukprot:SAG31_NODE_2533_length_5554_cov_2.350623_3_plen_139_part_00
MTQTRTWGERERASLCVARARLLMPRARSQPKTDDLSSVFIPLSAIVANPEFYADKERFPYFFNTCPDILAYKSDDKLKDRSEKKEGDFGDFYKKIVEKAQYWLSTVRACPGLACLARPSTRRVRQSAVQAATLRIDA